MNVRLRKSLLVFAGLLFFTGCGLVGGGGSSSDSPTTGWAYNDPDNGGFEVKTGYEQEPGPGLVKIEGGTYTMGQTAQDVTYDWNNVPRRVTVSSFFMDQTEVRNVDYREYLHWIQRVFIDYPEVYRNALPDTLVWRSALAYNEPYVQYYFRHPAYNNYPVVGVNWLQANDYCVWRTDRVNEMRLIEEGILELDPNQVGRENFNTEAYLAGQYDGLVKENLPSLDPNEESRIVSLEDGIILPRYRLPTEAEWEYAAVALIGNTYEERIYERRMFPWDGHNVRYPEGKKQGTMMANFKRGRGDMMGTAGDLNDNGSITVPVTSYWPNDYGLYCMAGNVNEWVADVYRPLSYEDVEDFNPYRGNVFETLVRNEDGSIAQKDSLGRLKTRPITEEEAAMRDNYNKADYRNYRDGDLQSRIDFENQEAARGAASTGEMYSKEESDWASLITDKVRVYKGGSWRDRVYWLNPATRRFLDEEKAKDDLGFRCAMTNVGSPGGMN
ncbi:MAG: SUMF1/EgtB/PvdO family nonheme iron enzyme [Bacteroidales bacterium]|jgi:gliding motility-associated lipoprotein GldJ|nr:SUMF1/EgtB/PvdO family nonheme iron enzyme [Bacteroidales bacterium]